MSEHDGPNNLEYVPLVLEQIRIFNSVLGELGVPELFENTDILFDQSQLSKHYLKFNLCRTGRNSVELDFHFSMGGMSIDFQGLPESFEFSETDLTDKEFRVKEFLHSLLSSPILVEYKGEAQFVNLFDKNGDSFQIWNLQSFFTFITRGYWKWQSMDQHLFKSIYSVKS